MKLLVGIARIPPVMTERSIFPPTSTLIGSNDLVKWLLMILNPEVLISTVITFGKSFTTTFLPGIFLYSTGIVIIEGYSLESEINSQNTMEIPKQIRITYNRLFSLSLP